MTLEETLRMRGTRRGELQRLYKLVHQGGVGSRDDYDDFGRENSDHLRMPTVSHTLFLALPILTHWEDSYKGRSFLYEVP